MTQHYKQKLVVATASLTFYVYVKDVLLSSLMSFLKLFFFFFVQT